MKKSRARLGGTGSLVSRAGRAGAMVEALEPRQLMAAVSWDGGGGDGLWSNPLNWSNDAIPGAADDVTIDVAGTPTIRFTNAAGVRTINSLLMRDNVTVEGGTLNVTATGTVESAAVFRIQGGTIGGGAWNTTQGTFRMAGGAVNGVAVTGTGLVDEAFVSPTLSGATTFTSLSMTGNGASLTLSGTYAISYPITIDGAGTSTRTIASGTNVTITPSGSVRLLATAGAGLTLGNTTLTNQGLIENLAVGRTLTVNSTTFNNAGSLTATAGTVTVSATTFANQTGGTAGVASGATLGITATNWSNAGNIAVNGGTLNLSGAWSTAAFNFAGFSRSGGTVRLTGGVVTNTAQNLTLNAATGTWELAGATIDGGQLTFAGGQSLAISSGSLLNVQANQELTMSGSFDTLTIGGSTTFPVLRLSGNGATVTTQTGYTLSAPIIAEGAGGSTRNVTVSGTLTISAGGVIRLAAGASAGLTLGGGTIINGGVIENLAAGRTLTINPTTYTNNAAVNATAGTVTISATTFTNAASGSLSVGSGATLGITATNWSNAGSLAVNNGTLSLAGAWSTAGFNFAGFTRTGGDVRLTGGTLTNTGQTLTLNAATGSWDLVGATISGGQLSFANGQTLRFSNSGGTLSDLQVNGELNNTTDFASVTIAGTTSFTTLRLAGSGTTVNFTGPYTLAAPVIAEGAGTSTRNIGGTGTLTIGAGGSVRLAASTQAGLTIGGGTVVNNGVIENLAAGRTLTINPTTFTNNATVTATAGTLTINPTTFTNAATGSLTIASGATLGITATNWSNAGSIALNGGILNLAGAWSTAGFNFAGFSRTGGDVRLSGGTLTNTGQTLTLNAALGSWELAGGTISGGQLSFANGRTLLFSNNGGVLLDLQVNGELNLAADFTSFSIGGTTRFTQIRFTANGGSVTMQDGYTLRDPILAEGGGSNTRTISMGTMSIAATGLIRNTAAATSGLSFSSGTLTNNGLIENLAVGRTLTIGPSTFTNNGQVVAGAGTVTINPTTFTNAAGGSLTVVLGATLGVSATNWSNAGVVTVNGGTLNLAGAWSTAGFNFAGFTRVGGAVRLTSGTLTNTGQTLTLNAVLGSWELAGGTIDGGQLSFANGQTLLFSNNGGTLRNLQVNGELNLAADFAAFSVGGTTRFTQMRFTANGGNLTMEDGYTLLDPIIAEAGGGNGRSVNASSSASIGPTGVVRIAAASTAGLSMSVGTVTNNGLIENLAPGRTLSVGGSTFINAGTLRNLAGTMTIGPTTFTNAAAGTFTIGASSTSVTVNPTTFTNAGALSLAGGELRIGATNWTNTAFNFAGFTRTGGDFRLTSGTLTITGTLPLTSATGVWNLAGGTISGGTITYAGSGRLGFTSGGGTLSNVTVNGTLDFNLDFASVTIAGSTTFTGVNFNAAGGQLSLPSTYTLSVPVLVTNTSASSGTSTLSGTTLTIAPGGVFRSLPGTVNSLSLSMATVVNNGLISAEATGRSLSMTGTTLTNTGVIQSLSGSSTLSYSTYTNVSSGTLTGGTWRFRGSGLTMSNFSAVSTLAATVEFSGVPVPTAFNGLTTITAAGSYTVAGGSDQTIVPAGGTFTNNGTLETGLGSRITLTGNYVQTSTGTYRVQLAGGNPNTNYGSLAISGNAVVAGSFDGVAVNGYVPARGQIQDVLTAVNGQTGTFSSVNFPSVVNPEWQSAFLYTGVGVRIIHTSIIDFDLSGEVDLTDFFQFFNWFDATDINADLDNSGEVDLNDFFLFLNLWALE